MKPISPPSSILLWVAGILFLLMLQGCSFLAAETVREPDPGFIPPAFSGQPKKTAQRQAWWHSFHNQELNGLIRTALGQNLTIKQAWARLSQARARAVAAGADRLPDLALTADTAHSRYGTKNRFSRTGSTENYALGLASSYEIDLWGRIRSEQEAAVLSATASREDLAAAATTVAAQVARRWVSVVAQKMHLALLQRQLEANETMLALLELRFRKSLATALDVLQQRQVVERSRARIPLVRRSERLLIHELALLLGKAPQEMPSITTTALVIPDSVPRTGLPIQLLKERPDVRAAVTRVTAADWQAVAARADRLPSLVLAVSGVFEDGDLSLLLENWTLRLAADLTAPIFDGQKRQAAADLAAAQTEESLAFLRETVLAAMGEVEDALVREQTLAQHLAGLADELDAAQMTLSEARSRYRNGLNDYLPVLTALLSVQSLEGDLIDRRADQILARIDLYRSLGGRWTDDLAP